MEVAWRGRAFTEDSSVKTSATVLYSVSSKWHLRMLGNADFGFASRVDKSVSLEFSMD